MLVPLSIGIVKTTQKTLAAHSMAPNQSANRIPVELVSAGESKLLNTDPRRDTLKLIPLSAKYKIRYLIIFKL